MRQKVTLKLIELVIVDENWISNALKGFTHFRCYEKKWELLILFAKCFALKCSYCLGMFIKWDGRKIKTHTYTFDVTHFSINARKNPLKDRLKSQPIRMCV